MRLKLHPVRGVAAAALLVCGCDAVHFTPEAKINAAVPLSQELVSALADMRGQLPLEQVERLETEVSDRLKIRATNCAAGYSPGWFSTVEAVRSRLTDRACFTQADSAALKWLGLRRVGLLLEQPPLRPVPPKPLSFYVADGFIMGASFAENAGVALLETKEKLQLIDLATGQAMMQEPKSDFRHAALSPNGRVFVMGVQRGSQIRHTETGKVLAELPYARPYGFHWVSRNIAVYNNHENQNDLDRATIIDFGTGLETRLKEVDGPVQGMRPVPGNPHRFVVGSYQKVSTIEILKNKSGVDVKLLREETLLSPPWALNNSGVTSDGAYCFSAVKDLHLITTSSLEQMAIPFGRFYLQEAVPTPDPDKVLLTGFSTDAPQGAVPQLLFSIGKRTLTPIKSRQGVPERFQYLPSFNRLVAIEGAKIAVLEHLPLGESVALEDFVVDPSLVNVSTAQREAQNVDRNTLAEFARDAQIEAVGVYEGAGGTHAFGKQSQAGTVEVTIRSSSIPIALVLSSYEPVRWRLTPEPGAKIAAVLVSSYQASQVEGAGSARVIVIGNIHAYKNGTSEFNNLDRQVFRLTGKHIFLFQGAYTGDAFRVGGEPLVNPTVPSVQGGRLGIQLQGTDR